MPAPKKSAKPTEAKETEADTDTQDDSQPDAEKPDLAEIAFRGVKFVIPRNRDDWSTEGLAYLSEEKYNLFVKYTLEIAGPGQWQTLCALCPRRKDFSEFFVLFGEAIKTECYG